MDDPDELLKTVCEAIFCTGSELTYYELLAAIERLAAWKIAEPPSDDQWEEPWQLAYDWGDIIIGAYWFCMSYHAGQASTEYRLMCQCGRLFRPAPSQDGPEPESGSREVADALELHFTAEHSRL